jgi:hypothetical protein
MHEKFRRMAWVTLIIVVVLNVCSVVGAIVYCAPIPNFGDPLAQHSCVLSTYMWVFAALNTISDFIVVLLPLPVLFGLRLQRRQKIGLFFLFAIGIL